MQIEALREQAKELGQTTHAFNSMFSEIERFRVAAGRPFHPPGSSGDLSEGVDQLNENCSILRARRCPIPIRLA
jgi:hypothetical protein